ncbi:MAG: tetratricopeptide repeat protein [Eggerthellaceae bacterium]|jgi:hypothetical protein
MESNNEFALTPDEQKKLFAAAGVEPDEVMSGKREPSFHDTALVIEDLSRTMIEDGPDALCELVAANHLYLMQCIRVNPEVGTTLVLCYKMGVEKHSGACATNLGALYYLGEVVDQDYKKAAELYQMAADWGSVQGLVNLGYIYEYGRTGTPDYLKAYQCYSLAAALANASEALCKMGDMFARGKAFPADEAKAMLLWEKSLETAQSIEEIAQPAFRIAERILNSDPQRALFLFQQAETGMRSDIANGMVYYRKRMQQAIEGQDKARLLLDADDTLEESTSF